MSSTELSTQTENLQWKNYTFCVKYKTHLVCTSPSLQLALLHQSTKRWWHNCGNTKTDSNHLTSIHWCNAVKSHALLCTERVKSTANALERLVCLLLLLSCRNEHTNWSDEHLGNTYFLSPTSAPSRDQTPYTPTIILKHKRQQAPLIVPLHQKYSF